MSNRDWVEPATFLLCEVGSGVHGIAQEGTDDHDEMGVCLEPYHLAQGIQETFEQHILRTAAIREAKHDAPSQPGDTDRTIYSLRKWTRLALKGNPSVILLLFAPSSSVRKINARGEQLRELAPAFVSRTAGAHYLGYLQAQRMRLLGERGQKNVNRQDLVAKFGYDTKYAGHMVRLGYQGVELLSTGKISLPMPEEQRAHVLRIRRGEEALNDVLTATGYLENELRDLCPTSPLPERPNTSLVEQFMLDLYFESWRAARFLEQPDLVHP